jgi:hypothetical protein
LEAERQRKIAEAKAKADAEMAQRIENSKKAAAEAALRLTQENLPPADRVDISRRSWKTGGFGTIGMMTFTLNNYNDHAVKDLWFRARSTATAARFCTGVTIPSTLNRNSSEHSAMSILVSFPISHRGVVAISSPRSDSEISALNFNQVRLT